MFLTMSFPRRDDKFGPAESDVFRPTRNAWTIGRHPPHQTGRGRRAFLLSMDGAITPSLAMKDDEK